MNVWNEVVKVVTENKFYDRLVLNSLSNLRGAKEIQAFLLDSSTSFEHDGLVRQQLVLMLTESELLVCYVEEIAEMPDSDSKLRVSTEIVPIRRLGPFQVQRYYSNPAKFGSSESVLNEVVLSLSWTGNQALDIGPASCDDPECTNEHGFTGQSRMGDYTAKYSLKLDNQYWIDHAEKFATSLEQIIRNNHD
jgi:hypothetical protein